MKKNSILLFSALLFSCGPAYKNIKQVFVENKIEQRRTLDNLPLPAGKSFFVLVFSETDSVKLNEPLTKTLQIDTTKEDVGMYRSLARDYVVVKLFKKEFEQILSDTIQYKTDSASRADYPNKGLSKSFIFITDSREIRIYGERNLDSPKEYINDLISVGLGYKI